MKILKILLSKKLFFKINFLILNKQKFFINKLITFSLFKLQKDKFNFLIENKKFVLKLILLKILFSLKKNCKFICSKL